MSAEWLLDSNKAECTPLLSCTTLVKLLNYFEFSAIGKGKAITATSLKMMMTNLFCVSICPRQEKKQISPAGLFLEVILVSLDNHKKRTLKC